MVGASQLTVAVPLWATAVTVRGLPGLADGVTLDDAVEAGLVPVKLVAFTVNV